MDWQQKGLYAAAAVRLLTSTVERQLGLSSMFHEQHTAHGIDACENVDESAGLWLPQQAVTHSALPAQ